MRNHFPTPRLDPASWQLEVSGLVERPLRLSLRELHNMRSETLVATLECAGNGRSAFDPPTEGEQWQFGAVSTAEWTGVPLAEILDRAGLQPQAREIVFRGADQGNVAEAADPIRFERSLPVTDAGQSGSLLAYAMNGEPLPLEHGYPRRTKRYPAAIRRGTAAAMPWAVPLPGWFMWQSTMEPPGAAVTVLRTCPGVKVAPASPLTEKLTRRSQDNRHPNSTGRHPGTTEGSRRLL